MKRRITLAMALLAGCPNEIQTPQASIDAGVMACTELGDFDFGCVRENSPVSVELLLPEEVESDETVDITAETPCVSRDFEAEFGERNGRQIAEAVFVAPPGASCRMVVTVQVANFERIFVGKDGNCSTLEQLCADTNDEADTDSDGAPDREQ